MSSLADLEPQVLASDSKERAPLASTLLGSSSVNGVDDEEGYQYPDDAEVMRRLAEAEADPSVILTEEEFWAGVSKWRSETP